MRYFSRGNLSAAAISRVLLGLCFLFAAQASVQAATLFFDDFNNFTPAAATPGNFSAGTPNGWTVTPGSGGFYSANASGSFNIGNVTNYGSLLLIQNSDGVATSTITSPSFTSGAGTVTISISAATRSTNAYLLIGPAYGGTGTIKVLLDGAPTTISQSFINPLGTNTGFAVYTATATVTAGTHTVALQWVAPTATINGVSVSDNTAGFDFVEVDGPAQAAPAPSITGGNVPITVSGGGAAIAIDPNVTITGGTTLNTASVSISANFTAAEDQLLFTAQNGITGAYSTTTGILTLSGTATVAQYQAALRTVQYQNTNAASPSRAARTASFSIAPGAYFPTNGHFYEFVAAPSITWDDAKTAAAARYIFGGIQGYLATITSQAENDFAFSKVNAQGWLGGSDRAVRGNFFWVTGPEGLMGTQGLQFYQGLGSGHGVPGVYNNFAPGEPNNDLGVEDSVHFRIDGLWNDFAFNNPSIQGYVVEYGGMPGDATLQLISTATVNIAAAPTLTASFNPRAVSAGSTVPLTFTLTNPNSGTALTGISFTDPLPAGLALATPNGLTGSAGGGTITATAGSSSISLSGATLAVGASATFTVNVFATVAGTDTNTTSTISSNEGGSGTAATAMLTVNPGFPASISIYIGDDQVAAVNTNVSIQPAVTVHDSYGNTVPNATVNYTIGIGGGSVTGATSTSNSIGVAYVGSWKLGTSAAGAITTTV